MTSIDSFHLNKFPLIFLFLQIVFASAFALIIKWVHLRRREDMITVGTVNYIVAAVAAFPYYRTLEPSPFFANAVGCGASMGCVYFIAFFFVIYCVKQVGASVTTTVSVLSLLFPIILAAVIWHENPGTFQSIGIFLALVALLLISLKSASGGTETSRRDSWFTPAILFIFFLLCGCSRLAQETFKHVSEPNQRPAFLFAAFGVTAVCSVLLLIYRHRIPSLSELLLGFLMGIANLLQTLFILRCLELFPGFIVFPVTSAGTILFTTGVATSFLGERIERRAVWGIGLAVLSLVMLNFD